MTLLRHPVSVLASATLALAASAAANGAHAQNYSVRCITNSNAAACQDGAATIGLKVSNAGNNQVDFTFTNKSLKSSSITEIYFDDGTLLGIATLLDSGNGVTFSQIGTANPGNLPGGQSVNPSFVATQGFMVDIGSGGPTKGVENKLDGGTQEFVTIRFNLINGKSYADTLAALNGPLGDGNDLRVGVHASSFAGASSESFVNNALPVPEPEGIVLSLTALGLLGFAARRRVKAQP